MRLIALLAAAGAVAALPRHVREANWAAIPADVADDKMQLIFATALWRHGDRASEHAVPGLDAFPEDAWTFGGGGYGELSPEGMRMHFELGQKIAMRYINETSPLQFLSPTYNAKEIYIRSTDYNRTLVSAYSNVAGMYAGTGVAGQNYPTEQQVPGWPTGYIPIPVHTVDYSTDYVGHPDAKCDRQDQLYKMVQESAEYQNYINDPQISQILKYLSDTTGTDVNIDNMYDLQDPIFCESNHIEELNQTGANIADFYPWFYTGDVPSWVDWIIDKDEDFSNGIANPGGVNGIDVSVEIPKIRAGDTLKLLVGNINGVLKCKDSPDDAKECAHFYKQLKYYALSAHDTTVAAFLTILGVKKYIIPEGYPNYSAAVFIEVYQNIDTGDRSFKILYHAGAKDDFGKPITAFVRGCDFKENLCPIAVLNDLVKKYAPETDMATLCNTPVNGVPPTTTPKPVTGSTPTTTTPKPTNTNTDPPAPPPTTSGVSTISLFSALSVMIASRLL